MLKLLHRFGSFSISNSKLVEPGLFFFLFIQNYDLLKYYTIYLKNIVKNLFRFKSPKKIGKFTAQPLFKYLDVPIKSVFKIKK